VGKIETLSKEVPNTPLISPASEKRVEVKKKKARIMGNEKIGIWVKNIARPIITAPVIKARTIPPLIIPRIKIRYGVGDTKISSICFINFAEKKVNAVFMKALTIIDIMTSPGTINCI
jgi:hypothetical protein